MLKRSAMIAGVTALLAANAYAAQAPAPADEGGPSLALIFSLMAVFISLGVVFLAAASKKKKD